MDTSQIWRFPKKYWELFKNISNEDIWKIIKALFLWDTKDLEWLNKAYYDIIKVDLDNLEKSAINGKKWGRPKKETLGYENKKPQVIENDNLKERERERERERESKDKDKDKDKDKYIDPMSRTQNVKGTKCMVHKVWGSQSVGENSNTNLSNTNLSNTNLSNIVVATEVATLQNYIKEEFNLEFINEIYNKYWIDKQDFKEECEEFINYWTETSINWKKEKWQKEKTFDPKLRFRTWMKNNKKWNSNLSFKNKVCEQTF